MGRKFFVGGNWKMNGDKASIDTIIAFLKAGPLDPNTGKLSFRCSVSFYFQSYLHHIYETYRQCNEPAFTSCEFVSMIMTMF